ncbi:MAG: hypothetical protein AB7U97_26445, partial [Pirellulales bacterium]
MIAFRIPSSGVDRQLSGLALARRAELADMPVIRVVGFRVAPGCQAFDQSVLSMWSRSVLKSPARSGWS